jgi:plasmid stabilization system protein ParE
MTRVRFVRTAERQALEIDTWWRTNRAAAPNLFTEELLAGIEQLRTIPACGALFAKKPGVRRLLLPRTRHWLFYRFHEARAEVLIHAVWHTSRGEDPKLR